MRRAPRASNGPNHLGFFAPVQVAAHAASDGTDNRAIVMAANEVCRRVDSKLILVRDLTTWAVLQRMILITSECGATRSLSIKWP